MHSSNRHPRQNLAILSAGEFTKNGDNRKVLGSFCGYLGVRSSGFSNVTYLCVVARCSLPLWSTRQFSPRAGSDQHGVQSPIVG